MILLLIFAVGCASLSETLKEIAIDPAGFNQEAADAADNVGDAIPELPLVFVYGLGYLSAFLRNWYKNYRKQQAKDLSLKIGNG